jgi:hypothetical protein
MSRSFLVAVSVAAFSALPAHAQAPAVPTITITAPAANATVTGPKVKVEASVAGWTLVESSTPIAAEQGHLHFFIDTPPDAVPEGKMIPADSLTKYVHAGKAPLTNRELTLAPGVHTIWVVAANSAHIALRKPAPVKVTFTVK